APRRLYGVRRRCAYDSGASGAHRQLRQRLRPKCCSPCLQPFDRLACAHEISGVPEKRTWPQACQARAMAERLTPDDTPRYVQLRSDRSVPATVYRHGMRHTREATIGPCWVIGPDQCASSLQPKTLLKLAPGWP